MNTDAIKAWFADRIDPETPADGPPPDRLGAFMMWSLKGCWPPLLIAAVGFALGGAFEAMVMFLLGRIVDATVAGGEAFWSANIWLLFLTGLSLLLNHCL